MSFDHWDEVRTAYQVARMGTVSGAAEVLGVHHATVIRHVDALEGRLGAKLFQRHARGYTPTEAGQDLLTVASRTDDQFTQLATRIRGRGDEVTGELIVTALPVLSALFAPAVAEFQREQPELSVRFVTDARVFRLEYGEAHVAIRAGRADDGPDNIVQPFFIQRMRLCATPEYVARHGPLTEETIGEHRFVGPSQETPRAPFMRWLVQMVPAEAIVYRVAEQREVEDAVLAGIGIGFIPAWRTGAVDDLVEMLPSMEEWSAPLWLVTHMDLHRTAKVQAFLSFLKDKVKSWPVE